MIRLQDMVPEVYYQQSRDFQFIGRLYDLLLNYAKTNTELINSLPMNENLNSKLLDLLTMTLGFKAKHTYNQKQLIAVCSTLQYALKNKGTITAIKTVCNAIFRAEGISQMPEITVSSENPYELILTISENISDLTLLKDMFAYILPAGMTITIEQLGKAEETVYSVYKYRGGTNIYSLTDTETGKVVKLSDYTGKTWYNTNTGYSINTTVIK